MGRAHHRRFLVPPEAVGHGQVRFSPAQSRQISAVLRLRAGDSVSVIDGSGRAWTARLAKVVPHGTVADIFEVHLPEPSPRLRLELAQVVPRGAAMDFIVGKATELGVFRIIPLEAERSVRRRAGSGSTARWRRILAEAAEQCGRLRVPELSEPCTLDEFLRTRVRACPLLACDNGGDAVPLATACRLLVHAATVTVLVGGEGGLSPAEVDRARMVGGQVVTLGPRVLRAETAALAALAVVQACVGDWAEPMSAPQEKNPCAMTGGTDAEHPDRG